MATSSLSMRALTRLLQARSCVSAAASATAVRYQSSSTLTTVHGTPHQELQRRGLRYSRRNATVAGTAPNNSEERIPGLLSALPGQHNTAKVIFEDNTIADFKYIWLRDNCRCPSCCDPSTKQKLLDTPALDISVKPKSLSIGDTGDLQIVWNDKDQHVSYFDSEWLFKYGSSFMHNTFESDSFDKESHPPRSEQILWDRTTIWKNLPELSYKEFMDSDAGVLTWLDMFHRYGIALLRGVPTERGHMSDVVERFAYVKQTQYGVHFDVINDPNADHLAFSGVALAYHTDMNYREKSPGMQLLHCLKANDPKVTGEDVGGRSMFVDGIRAARWMEENEPTSFHVLTSTPVRFSIKHSGMRYSAKWPVICTNDDGDVTEIHFNNRTMQPLQAPTHVVTPFYHAYKLFSNLLNDPAVGLEFNMVPGDLVAFNNRRVLHARSSFDPKKVDRHLQGCYVDIDEAFSKYDKLLSEYR